MGNMLLNIILCSLLGLALSGCGKEQQDQGGVGYEIPSGCPQNVGNNASRALFNDNGTFGVSGNCSFSGTFTCTEETEVLTLEVTAVNPSLSCDVSNQMTGTHNCTYEWSNGSFGVAQITINCDAGYLVGGKTFGG